MSHGRQHPDCLPPDMFVAMPLYARRSHSSWIRMKGPCNQQVFHRQ